MSTNENKLCVSLGNLGFTECLEAVQSYPFCEVRLDLLDLSDQEVKEIFQKGNRLIATFRAGKHDDQTRKRLLLFAGAYGASLMDIEIEEDTLFVPDVIKFAHDNNCRIIRSYHNFSETPGERELVSIIEKCFKDGADIAKIACKVNSSSDLKRLFKLYEKFDRVICFGMGELGRESRIRALESGAEFMYVSPDNGMQTAPGQYPYSEMRQLLSA